MGQREGRGGGGGRGGRRGGRGEGEREEVDEGKKGMGRERKGTEREREGQVIRYDDISHTYDYVESHDVVSGKQASDLLVLYDGREAGDNGVWVSDLDRISGHVLLDR